MRLSCKYPNVNINLRDGIYVFLDDNSSGKTYLLNMLKKMSIVDSVIGFTYVDSIENSVSSDKCVGKHVVMFDRYDMYKGKYDSMIKDLGKYAIVLVDCKDISGLQFDFEDCMIKLVDGSIEVFA